MQNVVQSRVRDYIKAKDIKQRTISRATGINEVALSNILNDKREMKADEYMLICFALGVTMDFFDKKNE